LDFAKNLGIRFSKTGSAAHRLRFALHPTPHTAVSSSLGVQNSHSRMQNAGPSMQNGNLSVQRECDTRRFCFVLQWGAIRALPSGCRSDEENEGSTARNAGSPCLDFSPAKPQSA